MTDDHFTDEMNRLFYEYRSVENSPPVERIPAIRKIYQRLMHVDASVAINRHGIFKNSIAVSCLNCLNRETYSFISPVVYKYFFNDNKLISQVKKVRNYIRHKKAHEKRRKNTQSVLFNQKNVCTDVIGLVVAYV